MCRLWEREQPVLSQVFSSTLRDRLSVSHWLESHWLGCTDSKPKEFISLCLPSGGITSIFKNLGFKDQTGAVQRQVFHQLSFTSQAIVYSKIKIAFTWEWKEGDGRSVLASQESRGGQSHPSWAWMDGLVSPPAEARNTVMQKPKAPGNGDPTSGLSSSLSGYYA